MTAKHLWKWLVTLVLLIGCQRPANVVDRGPLNLAPEKGTEAPGNGVTNVEPMVDPAENREPSLDIHESCTMNGAGVGTCKFTNIGQVPAAVCGEVSLLSWCGVKPCADINDIGLAVKVLEKMEKMTEVERKAYKAVSLTVDETGVFCSGLVPPATTAEVSFVLTQTKRYCVAPLVDVPALRAGGATWMTLCAFEFIRSVKE